MLKALSILLLFTLAVSAQSAPPSEFALAGAAYNQVGGTTGFAAYAKQLLPEASPGTYSFTSYDVTPKSWNPMILQSSVRSGIAQRAVTWKPITTFICMDAGAAVAGDSAGGSFGACGLASVAIGKTKWSAVFSIRGIKTSLADATVVYQFGIGRSR